MLLRRGVAGGGVRVSVMRAVAGVVVVPVMGVGRGGGGIGREGMPVVHHAGMGVAHRMLLLLAVVFLVGQLPLLGLALQGRLDGGAGPRRHGPNRELGSPAAAAGGHRGTPDDRQLERAWRIAVPRGVRRPPQAVREQGGHERHAGTSSGGRGLR